MWASTTKSKGSTGQPGWFSSGLVQQQRRENNWKRWLDEEVVSSRQEVGKKLEKKWKDLMKSASAKRLRDFC